MVLETSWGTRGGWIIVRDVLLIGPWHHEHDRSNTHRRAPTDYDADHVLLRTVRCVNGEVQIALDCEPAFDYGRRRAQLGATPTAATTRRIGRVEHSDVELRLTTDLNVGFEGPRATARHLMKAGEQAFCALSWSEHAAAADVRRGLRAARLDRAPLAALARARAVPRPPVAHAPAAQRADAQGPDLRPDRRDRRRGDDLAARDAGRRAQLGLPLQLDPRLDVRALGPLHARLRLGGQRLLLLRRRRRGGRARASCRSCTGSTAAPRCPSSTLDHLSGYEGARPVRIGNAATTRTSTTCGAPCSTPSTCTRSSRDRLHERVWPHAVPPGRGGAGALARARPRHLGGARRAAALHLLQADVLGRRRPRRAPGRAARGLGARGALARGRPTRSATTSARNALDERGVFTQHYDTDALDASVLLMPLVRFLPSDDERVRATVLAIADELTDDGLVLRYRVRGDRRRPARRGGHVHDLLVLAGLGAVRDRRARAGARPLRAPALLRQPARAVRRGDRQPDGTPPGQLPAGVHAPGADQRGHPRHPRRGGARAPGGAVPPATP